MINLKKHTINLGTGDVGVHVLQGGTVEKPIPVFAFYNLSNEEERILMGFFFFFCIDSMIAALQNVRATYYPAPVRKKTLGDTQQFKLD